jgi:hypothetical protein
MAIVRPRQTRRTDQGASLYVNEVQEGRVVGTPISDVTPDAFSAATLPLPAFARHELLAGAWP